MSGIAESRGLDVSPAVVTRRVRVVTCLLEVACLVVTTFTVLGTVTDPDLWGHLRFGLDLLQTHHLTAVDAYSFTQDVSWINHEWLSELIMAVAYDAGGTYGLMALKIILASAIFLVVLSALTGVDRRVKACAMLLAVVGGLSLVRTVRPHLWSLLALSLLCLMLTRRRLALAPLMFALWANLHGGWIVGLGVFAVWAIFSTMTDDDAAASTTWALFVASCLATLINPYGWRLWQFLATTVRTTRAVTEWMPLWTEPSILWAAWIVAAGLAIALLSFERRRLAEFAVAGMLGIAGLEVIRLAPMFVVATVVLLGPHMRRQWPAPEAWRVGRVRTALVLGLTSVCIGAAFLRAAAPMRCVAMLDGSVDPVPVAALQQSRARGRMVTWFDWGEYALWHLGPGVKVSMDGRRETIYSDDVIREQLALGFGDPSAFGVFDRVRPEYVWLDASRAQRTRRWLAQHDYRIDIDTGRSFLAVRSDLPAVARVAVEASGCFPGP
jgi:hypothetical protein